jgi:hypothetical protein
VAAAACTAQAPEPAAGTTSEAVGAGHLFTPVVTLNQVMVDVVNEHAHGIWDIDIPGNEPDTDAEWIAVRHAATTLAAAGSITVLGGSGANDRSWLDRPDWQAMSQAMTDAGLKALAGAERRNVEAVRAAGNELLLTCINCHRAYRLDVPNIWAEREQTIPER